MKKFLLINRKIKTSTIHPHTRKVVLSAWLDLIIEHPDAWDSIERFFLW
jgi:hypothetical protein